MTWLLVIWLCDLSGPPRPAGMCGADHFRMFETRRECLAEAVRVEQANPYTTAMCRQWRRPGYR